MTDSGRLSPLSDLYPDKTKLISFAGWQMPRDSGSILKEHKAVRNEVGFFDLSHMGRIIIRGQDADSKISRFFTRDLEEAETGRALYGFICAEKGHSLDDDIFYKRSSDEIWAVVNAANSSAVYNWLQKKMTDLEVSDVSENTVLLAVQGPQAPRVFTELNLKLPDKLFRACWQDNKMTASTGYSGEAGGEIWLDVEAGREVFQKLLELGVTFCGLGARDSLRLEKGYPLHGNELNKKTDPVTAGLDFFIDWEHEFIGKKKLLEIKNRPPDRQLRGIILPTRRSPRPGAKIKNSSGELIGEVTSSGFSPVLNRAIALALIDSSLPADENVEVEIPPNAHTARIKFPPFV